MDIWSDIVDFLTREGVTCTPMSQREAWATRQLWRENFALRLHQAKGRWIEDGIDWHVFSRKHARNQSGASAEACYGERAETEFLVFTHDESVGAIRCAGPLPTSRTVSKLLSGELDVYLCAPDMTWTMVFTHEQDSMNLGPYYSESGWQE